MMPGMLRYGVLVAAVAIAGAVYDRRARSSDAVPDVDGEARNVILVVADGLRWQELFRGADPQLIADSRATNGTASDVRRRFWRPTAAERRQALMPFVWGTLAPQGYVLGNRDLGSSVNVTNGMNFSYPGYNEMLVGYPDARINTNQYGPNPNVTVFEWLNRREEFRGRVAAVGAWSTFGDIFNRRRSGVRIHASRREPLDARAHAAAMEFLTKHRPRALFVAYVETDDHAHAGRYDLTLSAAHAVDSYLAALWSAVQSDPQYRGRTTMIFTADHGRGATARDWTDHGENVEGAEQTWLAMIGPDAPSSGEARSSGTAVEAQIAATVAAALGLDYRRDVPRAAVPILELVRR